MGCCLCKDPEKPSPIELGKARGCTDIPCLVIFIIFWFGMIAVATFSIVNGDPYRLLYGADSFGNSCGRSNAKREWSLSGEDLQNKSFLFAMDPASPFDSIWICVEKCPDENIYNAESLRNYASENGIHYCLYDIPVKEYANLTWVPSSNLGPCPVFPVFKSTPIMNRCIPNIFRDGAKAILKSVFGFLNGINLFQQVLSDVIVSYPEIIMMCFVAFILALIIVFFIRFMAGFVVYFIFGLVTTASLGGCGLLWYAYAKLKLKLDILDAKSNGTELLISETKNEHTILIYAIAASVVSAIVLLLVCCMWSSAVLVVDLFREAGRCLQAIPCLLLQPLYTFFFLILLFVYWSGVILYLATSSDISISEIASLTPGDEAKSISLAFNLSMPVKYFWWYHAIGLIWTAEFILAAQQMVVAGSVATWYFTRNKEEIGYPICSSIKRTIIYHAGSLAFGSLIITMLKIPRLILIYIDRKIRNSKSACAQRCLKCCICCLWCIERCCRYIHHNAYTIIAIEGQSFCPAAKQAFAILAGNAVQVSSINLVGDFVLFLGKCSVTAVTGIIAVFLLKDKENLHFYAIPLLLICIFAFFIAHCFFSVYEMTIDTLFLCFCADKDFSDRNESAVFADRQFISFMEKSKKAEESEANDEQSEAESEALAATVNV